MPALVPALLDAWRANAERWEPVRKDAEALGLRAFNPGLYAAGSYARFLAAYPPSPGAILALGLNPGPAGMAQTGIPFTDCRTYREKLGLGALDQPGHAPTALAALLRKADGRYRLTYERSSLVVYAFLEHAWGDLSTAYANWYVGNPCPLLFLEPDGSNVTPADPRLRRIPAIRDLRIEAVERFAAILRPRGIVALGNDVRDAVGGCAARLVGDAFVAFKHPAREPPRTWGRELAATLASRGLLRT